MLHKYIFADHDPSIHSVKLVLQRLLYRLTKTLDRCGTKSIEYFHKPGRSRLMPGASGEDKANTASSFINNRHTGVQETIIEIAAFYEICSWIHYTAKSSQFK